MSGRQAPEIYSRPLEEHEDPQKAISTLSLAYAAKGWNAVVTIDEGMVRWSRSFGQPPGWNKLRPVPGFWF